MNLRLLVKGRLGCLLLLIGIALVTIPVALCAAIPSATTGAPATTDDTANPYAIIVERNIFHLTTPPPPPEPEKPKVELPVVKITGIINIGDKSKVLFRSQQKESKEPVYYSLVEGETSGDGRFKLVKINAAQDAVDVINDGVATNMTVKDDSLAQSTEAAPAPGPGQPVAKYGPQPNPANGQRGQPMFRPGAGPPGIPGAGGFSFPTRARRNLSPPQPQ